MTNNETFTSNGTTYTASLVSTHVAFNGQQITTGRVYAFNVDSGHGWEGEMTEQEFEMWRAK